MSEWWQEAFGENYSKIYSHRSDEDAEKEIQGILPFFENLDGIVLDACCGNGRHQAVMNAHNIKTIGFDFSEELLLEASQRKNASNLRADMKALPYAENSFAAITMFFTAFGYFDDNENKKVLQKLSKTLKSKGLFLLDLPNAKYLMENLIPKSERIIKVNNKNLNLTETRCIKNNRVNKTVDLEGASKYTESVRLYTLEEIIELGKSAGLKLKNHFKSLKNTELDDHRMVVVFEKA